MQPQANQEELFQYVYTWLKKKYKNKPIPKFEVTPTTLSYLYNLAKINENRDRDCEVLIQEYEQRTIEYTEHATKLHGVLHSAGVEVEPDSLLSSCVETLASLAATLGISDTQTSSYYIALNNLRSKIDKVAAQRAIEKQLSGDILSKTQGVIQRLAKLRSVVEQLEEKAASGRHVSHIRKGEISYLSTKRAEYEQEITAFNSRQTAEDFDRQFTHPVLVASAQQLAQLQELTAKLTEELASYMDLPPDINLAKLKIEEARNRLAALEEQLSARLNGIL